MPNETRIVLASASRTATVTTDAIANNRCKGIHLVIDATAKTATPSVTPKIQGLDANGVWYDVLVGAAITDTGTTVLKVFPGASPVANAVANDYLPPTWRVVLTHGDADALTYTVGATLFGD